jgi:hypothetical protein
MLGASLVEVEYRAQHDAQDTQAASVVVREGIAKPVRKAQHELAHRHVGKNVLGQVLGELRHSLAATAGADRSAFTAERNQPLVAAASTLDTAESVGEHATSQIATQFLLDEARHAALAELCCTFEEGRQMRADDAMQQRIFGSAR